MVGGKWGLWVVGAGGSVRVMDAGMIAAVVVCATLGVVDVVALVLLLWLRPWVVDK